MLTVNKWTYKVAECEYHKQPAIGQGSMFANSAKVWFDAVVFNCSLCPDCWFKIDSLWFCN